MKSLISLLLTLIVIGGIGLFVFSRWNHSSLTPQTVDLAVDCSEINNVLVTSTVNVTVKNLSSRPHNNVSVKIDAFDGAGNRLKEKYTTFTRTLLAKSLFDKPVTLPPATKRCDCTIVSAEVAN